MENMPSEQGDVWGAHSGARPSSVHRTGSQPWLHTAITWAALNILVPESHPGDSNSIGWERPGHGDL